MFKIERNDCCMIKKSIIIWGVAIVLLFVAAFTAYQNKPNNATPQLEQNTQNEEQKVLARDFTLKDLNEKNVKLSDYKGKIVVLNFWAVWCKYCKQEMPDFNELNNEFEKGNDAVILAVDVQEDISIVNKFLNENNLKLNVLLDTDGKVAQQYDISGFPTTFIIGKDGSVEKVFPGLTNRLAVLDAINKLK